MSASPSAQGILHALLTLPQVATPRVRSASKKAVPALGDHVSKLNCVGSATQVWKCLGLSNWAHVRGQGGLAAPAVACLLTTHVQPCYPRFGPC